MNEFCNNAKWILSGLRTGENSLAGFFYDPIIRKWSGQRVTEEKLLPSIAVALEHLQRVDFSALGTDENRCNVQNVLDRISSGEFTPYKVLPNRRRAREEGEDEE